MLKIETKKVINKENILIYFNNIKYTFFSKFIISSTLDSSTMQVLY